MLTAIPVSSPRQRATTIGPSGSTTTLDHGNSWGRSVANLILLWTEEGPTYVYEVGVHPEATIEKLLFGTKNMLPDVVLLRRQRSTYAKEDRIDLVGVDGESRTPLGWCNPLTEAISGGTVEMPD